LWPILLASGQASILRPVLLLVSAFRSGKWFDRQSYPKAIAKACKRHGIQHWHPNQLRHTTATKVRQQFGLEAAQVIHGHSRADVTQVYAERNTAAGLDVMGKIG
jgi:site-specific recombinase XerC